MENDIKDELIILVGAVKLLATCIGIVLCFPIMIVITIVKHTGYVLTAKTALPYALKLYLNMWDSCVIGMDYQTLSKAVKSINRHYGYKLSDKSKRVVAMYYFKSWRALNR